MGAFEYLPQHALSVQDHDLKCACLDRYDLN